MKIEIDKLLRVNSVIREKDLTAKYVYTLIEKGIIDGIKIDGMQFIINNEKYQAYTKKGRKKEA